MFIPIWILLIIGLLITGLVIWTVLLVIGRNPLPFPDFGSRIFSASSAEGKDAMVELLAINGIKERFQANSDGVSALHNVGWHYYQLTVFRGLSETQLSCRQYRIGCS